MRILAVEPFYGGSHQAFLDGWTANSQHQWTTISFSPHHWKWRMRHAPISAAAEIRERRQLGNDWDLLLCSDMLNLAELRGLAPEIVALPTIAYFHENQLTYPVRETRERDQHFAVTNFTTALTADRIWFNSAFHRDDFLGALPEFWQRLPDHRPLAETEELRAKCDVQPPGVADSLFELGQNTSSLDAARPPQLTWAARWEFDKNPDAYFAALAEPQVASLGWTLNVLGQRFPNSPDCFATAEKQLAARIKRWGELERPEFVRTLAETDIFVSTAIHEFFGIAVVEAIAAGAVPLLPNRLAYPELLAVAAEPRLQPCLYAGDDELPDALARLLGSDSRVDLQRVARRQVERFAWSRRAAEMDARVEDLIHQHRAG